VPNRLAAVAVASSLVASMLAVPAVVLTAPADAAPVAAAPVAAAPVAAAPVSAAPVSAAQVAVASIADPAAFVDAAYRGLLGRPADPAGGAYWSGVAASDPRALLDALAATVEHRRWVVAEAYRSVLGREPDEGGLAWLAAWMTRGSTGTIVRAVLFGSDEYLARAGGTPDAFVRSLYRDVLGREADAAGLAHFTGVAAAGVPRPFIAYAFLASPEAAARPGLSVASTDPPAGVAARTLEAITVTLDRPVVAEASTVVVTVEGRRLAGTVGPGDFPDTLVFQPAGSPDGIPQGTSVGVEVTVLAFDGAVVERAEARLVYERPVESLRSGDQGAAVADLQRRLEAIGYWVGAIDGRYTLLTQQAVMAFQKTWGLERTGVADSGTLAALAFAPRPRPRSTTGTVFEVDKARQLVLWAKDGRTVWVFNTSTGTEQPYWHDGRRYLADTPPGRFRITRQYDGVRDGALGRLYRPKYFHPDGIAFHGSPSVPGQPASHGCVRLTNPAMDFLWASGAMPIGAEVWVY
jgi:lipoprotein-anchoring transpeptidase ErfK/SrfK